MPLHRPSAPHKHGSAPRTGVLLTNLGSPDAPEAAAVRTYLKQFLSDPRVVEIPRLPWWLILNGLILNVRPRKSAAKYRLVWTPKGRRSRCIRSARSSTCAVFCISAG